MSDSSIPDWSCVPYSRKKVYMIITLPLMLLILIIFGYLFFLNPFFGIIYISFWFGANIFQSYCCEYQDCPYTDGFCPAVAGIIPASRIANLPIIKNMKKSKTRFDLFATFGSLCLIGLIVFPVFFIVELGILYPLGYIVFIVIYAILFLWNVCPVCAIRGTCPGGKASTTLRNLLRKS